MTLVEKVKEENTIALKKLKEKLERKEKQVEFYKFLFVADVRKFNDKKFSMRFINFINEMLEEKGFEKIHLDDKDETMFKINLYLKTEGVNQAKSFFNTIKIPLTEGKFNIYQWSIKLHEWHITENKRADEIIDSINNLKLNNANLCDIVDRIENSLDSESIALLKKIL